MRIGLASQTSGGWTWPNVTMNVRRGVLKDRSRKCWVTVMDERVMERRCAQGVADAPRCDQLLMAA